MTKNMQAKLDAINAEIELVKPYAKRCLEYGLNVVAKPTGNGIHQGTVDRALRFIELVAKRDAIENQE